MPDKQRILIVDDDADYRASTRALLEGEGYEVEEVDSGRAGIERARQSRPDLIVLDIMMESPVEGYTVVQALKYHDQFSDVADIPIVMCSSVQEDPRNLFPRSADVPMITPDAYFTKPWDVAKFLECVRDLLNDE